MQILNALKFQEQLADLNSKAQVFILQLSHEIRNAPNIDIPLIGTDPAPDEIVIRKLDFETYPDFREELLISDNWGTITYEIVTDQRVVNGVIPTRPYLLRREEWPNDAARNRDTVLFEGFIFPSDTVLNPDDFTFRAISANRQTIEIQLKLLPRFDRRRYIESGKPPIIFPTVVTMRSSFN